ncbi:MAG: metallophosphoesterase [Methanosarcinales archaeon]|nr:metallophosphoesterase [Methanosarcinales archaeon]
MIIVVASDVHLGYEKCNKADFLEFLDRCDSASIDHLFLLGDILDFWRRNNARAVLENNEIIEKIAELNVRNIHYIVGNRSIKLR